LVEQIGFDFNKFEFVNKNELQKTGGRFFQHKIINLFILGFQAEAKWDSEIFH